MCSLNKSRCFFQFLNVVEFDRRQRDMGNGP